MHLESPQSPGAGRHCAQHPPPHHARSSMRVRAVPAIGPRSTPMRPPYRGVSATRPLHRGSAMWPAHRQPPSASPRWPSAGWQRPCSPSAPSLGSAGSGVCPVGAFVERCPRRRPSCDCREWPTLSAPQGGTPRPHQSAGHSCAPTQLSSCLPLASHSYPACECPSQG